MQVITFSWMFPYERRSVFIQHTRLGKAFYMLQVPWSKVWSIRGTILQVLRVLIVFELYEYRDTARARSISKLCIAHTAKLGVFPVSITRVILVLAVFGPQYCLYSQLHSQYFDREYSNTLRTQRTKYTRYSE